MGSVNKIDVATLNLRISFVIDCKVIRNHITACQRKRYKPSLLPTTGLSIIFFSIRIL
jgi:hypothetical protein